MKILYRRCAALDVHKKTVCACVRLCAGKGEVEIHRETFGAFTDDLERLAGWLKSYKVRRVAMESTGVYWTPVWNVLEQKRYGFDLTLVNPATVKALAGQKTDPKDAQRIAELHQYGLLRNSFIPPPPIRRLRDLVRSRVHLEHDQNRITNRIAGLLEKANFKLRSVASSIKGMSVLRMLYAMVEGERDPVRLAKLALGSLREKQSELARAMNGRFSDHFDFQLQQLLEDLQYNQHRVDRLERKIRNEVSPYSDIIERLRSIPAVDEITAWAIISEIGADMTQFPTANHLASWAGLCPGNDESAGKRRSGRARKGNRYLRRTLLQNAWAISHKDGCFLTALFWRVERRRGRKRAAMAVAHRLLIIAYHIIHDGVVYRELGGDFHDHLRPLKTTRRLVDRLDRLGFQVDLRPKPAAPVEAPPTQTPGAAEPVRRGRGRPKGAVGRGYRRHKQSCPKCLERGIPCFHEVKPAPGSAARPSRPRLDPTANANCSLCSRWGIPCIHVRKQLQDNSTNPSPC
jgi:transposase